MLELRTFENFDVLEFILKNCEAKVSKDTIMYI